MRTVRIMGVLACAVLIAVGAASANDYISPTNTVLTRNSMLSSGPEPFTWPNGVVITDFLAWRPNYSFPIPLPGSWATLNADLMTKFSMSLDGGAHWTPVSAPASAGVLVNNNLGSNGCDGVPIGLEMVALNVSGGGLPPGIIIRESPTRPSPGSVTYTGRPQGDFAVDSFFDIWTELSADGGMTWWPAGQSGHLASRWQPGMVAPTPFVPPVAGILATNEGQPIVFPSGVVLKDVRVENYTQVFPPPPPGGTATHTFGTAVDGLVSTDGGMTFMPVTAPATVTLSINSVLDQGSGRVFETELLALDISGGGLPAGVLIRESPIAASLGLLTEGAWPTGDYRITSFFDVFTELSLDGGQTWQPALTGSAELWLTPEPATLCLLGAGLAGLVARRIRRK